MTAANQTVLHEYKTTVLFWLIPLFFVISCMMLAMAVTFPMFIEGAAEPGARVSLLIAWVAGLALPPLAVILWLLVPAVVTRYDAAQGAVVVEHRRPLGRVLKTYRVGEIADIRPVGAGDRTFALHMLLKDGRHVPLEYGASSDLNSRRAKAAWMKQVVGLGTTGPALRV